VNFTLGKFYQGQEPPKMYIWCTSPGDAKHRAKFGSPPVNDVAAYSNEGKTRNPLKFAGVPQTPEPISAVSGPKFVLL